GRRERAGRAAVTSLTGTRNHRAPQTGLHLIAWAVVVGAAAALFLAPDVLPWAAEYPKAGVVRLRFWISDFMAWLINDLSFGLFTFTELARSVSWLLDWPLQFACSLLAHGFRLGEGSQAVELWPRLPWLAVIAIAAAVGHYAGGRKLALLVALCFGYLAVFG